VDLLFTSTAYPPAVGGAQLLMHELARALRPRHAVRVLTQWDTNRTDWLLGTTLRVPTEEKEYEIDGIAVARLALPAASRRRLAPWVAVYPVAQGAAIRRIAAALAPEVARRAQAADLIHNCRIGREGLTLASLQVARARGIPFVLTPVHHPRWGGWLHRHYHRIYREADAVIALTEAERRTLAGLGVDERRIFVTGMGPVLAEKADGARFRERHALGRAGVVLFLGQKYAYKGIGPLLEAARSVWRRRPDVRFVFIGPRTPFSRRRFAREVDPRVLELAEVGLEEKTDALDACDVLCVPSAQESFGGVFTEAWMMRRPVVGGDIPAVREVIEDGEDGFLVPPQPASIAERLLVLLDDPALRARMAERGRLKVEARFTWPRLAERTEEVYRRALAGGSTPS
jgi:glycosyltransferase involved in cell wall biosynthesis